MEEKERRPIPTMQASRDVHSNSSSILLNTTCISPSAGPTGSRPQSVVNLIKVLECMCFFFGERSGSVVVCWTQDRRAAGRSLTGATALWSLSKTGPYITERLLMVRKELLKSNLYVGFKSVLHTQDYRPNQS